MVKDFPDLVAYGDRLAEYALERAVELRDQRNASTDPKQIAFINRQIETADNLYSLTLDYVGEMETRAAAAAWDENLKYAQTLTPEGRAALFAGGPVPVNRPKTD